MSSPRGRFRLLLPALVIGFILVSVAEVWLLTLVGSQIGVLWTLTILIAEALIGAWLLRREGRKSWSALVAAYQAGRTPTGHLADAALVLAGGIMLILPGFFTDVIGLIFLVPFTRTFARKGLGWMVARSVSAGRFTPGTFSVKNDPTVVTGEVVDEAAPTHRPNTDPTVLSGEIDT
jgi:UPF0716 protein FxsA